MFGTDIALNMENKVHFVPLIRQCKIQDIILSCLDLLISFLETIVLRRVLFILLIIIIHSVRKLHCIHSNITVVLI